MSRRNYFFCNSLLWENLLLTGIYWLLSHLNFLIFSKIGILPMPIWPAAGIALAAFFIRGGKVAPSIAAGTILANHYSLGANWAFSCSIALMNTLGPWFGATLIRKTVSKDLIFKSTAEILIVFAATLVIIPVMTASGGAGFKCLLGLLSCQEFGAAWIKWAMAHSLGDLFIGVPILAWYKTKVELQ
jgi:integral membrane sensor domain MASE1